MAERDLPKVEAAGSTPVSRSTIVQSYDGPALDAGPLRILTIQAGLMFWLRRNTLYRS